MRAADSAGVHRGPGPVAAPDATPNPSPNPNPNPDQAADAEALREDAAHQPVTKPPAASEGDAPVPPPRATSLSSGTRKAAAGVRELSEGAAFLMQLRAMKCAR